MEQILYYFFNFKLIAPYLPQILKGFELTLEMGVATVVGGTLLGLRAGDAGGQARPDKEGAV